MFSKRNKRLQKFCEIVKPDAINIDYDVDPQKIVKDIKIPVQGGLDPKILLTNKEISEKKLKNI